MVPHGMAVSLTAPEAFRFTFEAAPGAARARRRAARARAPTGPTTCATSCPQVLTDLMRDIDIPNGIGAVGLRRGRRRRPRRGHAQAAAAARHRARGGHRGRPRRASCAARSSCGERRRCGDLRRAAPARASRDVDDSDAGPGAVLHRRLALPRRPAGRGPAARTSTSSPRPSAVAREHRHPADHARRRHVDRRQRRGHRHRRRHLPAPEPGALDRPRGRAPPSSSPAPCTPPCSGPRPRTGCASAPTRRRTPAAPIGGMIGNNACGSRALGYGRTADNVVGLDVLTADGEPARAGRAAAPRCTTGSTPWSPTTSATIRTEFGRFSRQVSGYSLEHLLPEHGRDLGPLPGRQRGHARAWSLGATVRLVEDAPFRALAVLGYPSMFEAADAVPGPAAPPAGRLRGPGRPDRRRRPRPARAASPTCPAAPAGCSPRSPAPPPSEAHAARRRRGRATPARSTSGW